MEIERKFLLKSLPADLETYPHTELEQAYLASGGTTVRVRRDGDRYVLTVKKKSKESEYQTKEILARIEIEEEIDRDLYERLLRHAESKVIRKTRYRIPYLKYTIELDIFHGELEGLQLAEIEFPNMEEAKLKELPEWFGEDVTEDKRYRNSHLAKNGLS